MDSQTFVEWAVNLLEDIETNHEKKAWCQHYSVYSDDFGQDELHNNLKTFFSRAYSYGLIITNYDKFINLLEIDERLIIKAEPDWVSELSYEGILTCIAYHFRRDHFIEGSLINDSITSGAMFRLFSKLRLCCMGSCLATTLDTVYKLDCGCIPNAPGVYQIIAPQKMKIQFENSSTNFSASLYPVEELEGKYQSCLEQHILYIGKANGRHGLRQRIRQYVKYGWNEAINHKGGRAIWQIKDADMLLLKYECCSNCEDREHQLLKEFKKKNNCYPLANWRG